MLNQETKRKIDSARDILVGKVPDPKAQVEQITTALIYKFMDDMDKEAQELGGKARFFTNGYEKYAWTKLMDAKLSGHERLNLYLEAINSFSRNPHIPQLFRDIFKDAFLPYRSPETLNLFLKEINGFVYDHSENLGDAFEYLLSILGSQGDAGQFRTPRHIIDFIVTVVDPKKDETICDPACGTAGFLISAFKHILRSNKEKPLTPDERKKLMDHFVGYDISPDMVRLSKVNLYLHGFPNPTIYEYDTLTSEDKWDENFDVMLANPPFMTPKGGIKPHKRFSVQANRSEVLFVDYILEHLRPNGRAGIIVPEGIIFQSAKAYKTVRKLLIEDGLLAVISLPSGVFNPYSGVKTSILIFDNGLAKKTKDILFLKIQNDGFDLGAQRRPIDKNDLPEALAIIKGYQAALKENKEFKLSERQSKTAHLVAKDKIAESGEYNLSGNRYRETTNFTNQKWPMVNLVDYVFFQEGPGIRSHEYDFTNKGYPIINVRCVQDGFIDLSNCRKVKPELANGKWDHFKIQEGDILFTTSGTIGRVSVVKKENLPLLMNTSVVRFRSKDVKILDNNFLYQILKSNSFVNALKNKGTGMAQINVGPIHIKQMKIPLPPLEVQKEIVEQIEVKQKVIEAAKAVIENLERERRYFGQSLRKIEGVKWVELGELIEERTERVKDKNIQVWSVSNTRGFVNTGEYFEKQVASTDTSDYKVVHFKYFAYNPSRINVGSIAFNNIEKVGCVSPMYVVFKIINERINPEYLFKILKSDRISYEINLKSQGTVRKQLRYKDLITIKIPLPPLEVQKRLVAEMEELEKIIEANKKLVAIMEQKIADVLSEI